MVTVRGTHSTTLHAQERTSEWNSARRFCTSKCIRYSASIVLHNADGFSEALAPHARQG